MKDDKYFKILDAVLRLDVAKGHMRWKISDVSRGAGVQRTLIYYYFGKSKEAILKAALQMIGDEFFGLSPERVQLWQTGNIRESVIRTRKLFERAPHIAEFYFHWRHTDSPVQKELIALEKRYMQKLKSFFPKMDAVDMRAIFTLVSSLVIFPEVSEDVVDRVLTRAGLTKSL